MMLSPFLIAAVLLRASAFAPQRSRIGGLASLPRSSCSRARTRQRRQNPSPLFVTADDASTSTTPENDAEIQWDLFQKHHAKGSWKGIWTSYDYIGDIIDETIGSVDYEETPELTIQQSHTIVVGAKRSDCETCFDSMETKNFPVALYGPGVMRKARLGSIGMVNGPSLLRSGVMATELVLSYGDGRIRVTFQHAPVWPRDVEPGNGPPAALKLFRTMVSREALRDTPPTTQSEEANPPSEGNPTFYRGVPPFAWHKVWGGTSWTWGPQAGNQGWAISEMEEVDAWHGRPTGDTPNVWNLRLGGGVLLQTPRLVNGDEVGIFRLAWLPNEDTLLRLDAGIVALEPIESTEDDSATVGFYPPSLASYRCDVLKKLGELENASLLVRQGEQDVVGPRSDEEIAESFKAGAVEKEENSDDFESDDDAGDGDDSGLDAIRAAIQL